MWAGLCWLIVRFGDQGPALGAVSRKKANLWSHSKIWHDWVKLKIMTSESRWRGWDGVLRFLNTATRLQKVDSSKETPGILPKLRLVRVSLEAWAWLYLVAYLQVAILLTLQKYHLETGSLYFCISLYSAWLQRPVTQLPSSYFPNHFDRNGVWLRSHQSQPRQQNAVNQHFN